MPKLQPVLDPQVSEERRFAQLDLLDAQRFDLERRRDEKNRGFSRQDSRALALQFGNAGGVLSFSCRDGLRDVFREGDVFEVEGAE